jgi:hypothetical protein
MYLFSRRTRLEGGNGTKGIEWATEITEKVKQITGLDVGLWANVYSPAFGTISFTAFIPDLAAIETAGDKLQVDSGYQALSDKGATLTTGGLDDALFEIIAGTPDPEANAQYVNGVRAVCAGGQIARAMEVGVTIAEKASAITGANTLFVRSVTGSYGGVGWLTGFPDIAALEASQNALAADADWLAYLDKEAGTAYVEDPTVTESIIYRKLA